MPFCVTAGSVSGSWAQSLSIHRYLLNDDEFGKWVTPMKWFGGALHNCQASQSTAASFPGSANTALAGAAINYKRWSVINSNCNWIAFMPPLWNIRPPVPVADSLWWGVLVTWIISPWGPAEPPGYVSVYPCVHAFVCFPPDSCVCERVRGRGLARVSGVATSQPRKSYPREGEGGAGHRGKNRKMRKGRAERICTNWCEMDPIPYTRTAELAVLIGETPWRASGETFSSCRCFTDMESRWSGDQLLGIPNLSELVKLLDTSEIFLQIFFYFFFHD